MINMQNPNDHSFYNIAAIFVYINVYVFVRLVCFTFHTLYLQTVLRTMADSADKLQQVKSMLRSVLLSVKEGVKVVDLQSKNSCYFIRHNWP